MQLRRPFALALFGALSVVSAASAAGTREPSDPRPDASTRRPAQSEEAPVLPPGYPGSPFATDAEVLDFLRHARVVSVESIPTGVTEPQKVLLEQGEVRARAVFRYLDEVKEQVWLGDRKFYRELHDSALFEVAAYRLAVRIGIDNVPPAVLRTVGNRSGSLQLWIDDAVTEADRRRQEIRPADIAAWSAQLQRMALFDAVLGNIDRHPGNYLLDSAGKLWMIDHTRAFQKYLNDWTPERVTLCERPIWRRLRALDRDELESLLAGLLTSFEIDHLAGRVDKVVAHLHAQIAARGEDAVIVAGVEATESR